MTKSLLRSQNNKRQHNRPCDACSVRKVRCDLHERNGLSCTNCSNHGIDCTDVRVRRKSGPKRIRQETKNHILELVSGSQARTQQFSLNQIIPYLQVYQMWFYPMWPIVSTKETISMLEGNSSSPDSPIQLVNDKVAELYALSCAVCAAVSRHKHFLRSLDGVFKLNDCPQPSEYIEEARRVIYERELKMNPTPNLLVTSYFMYMYYDNVPGGTTRGLVYIREAVSLAHIMGLHEKQTYASKSPVESHYLRKIYYQVMITERYIGFECNLPVILEPNDIEIPSLQDDDYPDLLLGFTELAHVFSSTDNYFFKELQSNRSKHSSLNDFLSSMFPTQDDSVKKNWLYQIQKKLCRKIQSDCTVTDAQKVNIILSKAWFQSLAWLMSSENFLLQEDVDSTHCFSTSYPLSIAKEFLKSTNGLPDYAFESNGPGAAMKLLEIANSLYTSSITMLDPSCEPMTLDCLNEIFSMVVRLKSDMELPKDIYGKILSFLESKRLSQTRLLSDHEALLYEMKEGKIEEIFEGYDNSNATNSIEVPQQTKELSLSRSSSVLLLTEMQDSSVTPNCWSPFLLSST